METYRKRWIVGRYGCCIPSYLFPPNPLRVYTKYLCLLKGKDGDRHTETRSSPDIPSGLGRAVQWLPICTQTTCSLKKKDTHPNIFGLLWQVVWLCMPFTDEMTLSSSSHLPWKKAMACWENERKVTLKIQIDIRFCFTNFIHKH